RWLARLKPFLVRVGDGDARIGTWLTALLIVTAFGYSRSLGNGFLVDDWNEIVRNRLLGNWSFIWESLFRDFHWFLGRNWLNPYYIYYRPLKNVWNAFVFHVFGLHAAGFHVAMIALHLVVVWLAFRVGSLLAADRWAGLLAAALFALTPVNAATVSFATNNEVMLCAAFELAAFECYLRGVSARGDADRRRWRIWSLGWFAAALLSYEAAVVFPVLTAAHALLFPTPTLYLEGNGDEQVQSVVGAQASSLSPAVGRVDQDAESVGYKRRAGAAILAIWPYAAELGAYLLLHSWVLGPLRRAAGIQPDPIGSALTIGTAFLTNQTTIVKCALFFAMPWRAGPRFPSEVGWPVALFVVTLGVLCGVAALFLRHPGPSSLERRPQCRLYLFCAAWYVLAFGPSLAFNNPAPRSLYFPSFGLLLMGAVFAIRFARASEAKAKAVKAGIAVVLIANAAILFSVQHIWRDDAAYWAWCAENYPHNAANHLLLATALESKGDLTGARRELRVAINITPDYAKALQMLAEVDEKLGLRQLAEQMTIRWFRLLEDPTARQYVKLALAADAAGDEVRAEAALAKVAALPGGATSAAIARAHIDFRHGDKAGAEKVLSELLQRQPDNRDAMLDLAMVLASENRYNDAIAIYRRAASGLPSAPSIHYRIAVLLHQMGRDREARDECAIALKQAPEHAKAQALMAELDRSASTLH
ncbi:MAG TPA: tetratricopeptide repeat protein, partial [Candidatus Binataceae bacterium]|nr:tetratricopeptide repeat protein [Candidatus Binataceae bacterium]